MIKRLLKIIKNVFFKIAECIIPIMPILVGVGMLKVILIILGPYILNILSEADNTYIVLSFVADAGYYFLPIYVAVASAEVFDTNKFLAALMGGMLISPAFVELVNNNTPLTIFGLKLASTNYSNQILPSIIIVFIESYVYKYLSKFIPKKLSSVFSPMLTIIIMIPVAFCLIGPVGVYLGEQLVKLVISLKNMGPLGFAIMTALAPFVVIAGLGGASLSVMLSLAASGVDPILFFSNVLFNSILGFVTLALYIRNKDAQALAASITSTVGGSSEPAIFGYVIKDFSAMLSLIIASFFAGLYAGIMQVKTFSISSFGFLGLVSTIGPNSSIVHATISLVIGCVLAFVLTLLTHKKR